MTALVGVDTGLTGALCVLSDPRDDPTANTCIEFIDIPTLEVGIGKGKKRREYDIALAVAALDRIGCYYADVRIVIEKTQAMPRRKLPGATEKGTSAITSFSMGEGLMLWKAIAASLHFPYELVTPQRWKKDLRIPAGAGKDAGRKLACELYPQAAPELARVKDQGRADALLIAHWYHNFGKGDSK